MANRYDRDPDDYGFGRRDTSRDDDEHRYGQYAQNRYGENRQNQNPRQNPWRIERDRNDRFEQDYRGRAENERTWRGSDNRGNEHRGNDYSDNNYHTGRENFSSGRDQREGYYSSGRDRDSSNYGDRDQRSSFGNYERDRGWNESQRHGQSWDRGSSNDRSNYRGLYQEQVWTRDPSSGNIYGYEYSTRLDPRRFNAGDETRDRWRSNVNDQNRRFDIDRGWHTPGTSGYGNTSGHGTSGFESQYGRGPKGYVRSDERIREDVCDRLSDDDEIDARDITVTVKNADVILEGTVIDRRSKHRAEDIAESISGVKNVTNQLRARKGFFQELGDKISGDDEAEHHGHRGSGTRNTTTGGTPQKTAH
jgi:osmotically-inducible protein OsmY